MRLAPILILALLGACASPFVGRIDADGKCSARFDGRYLAVTGEGKTTLGITDKAGAYVYPPGAPLALGPAAYSKGYDVKAKAEIPFEDAKRLLGWVDPPAVP